MFQRRTLIIVSVVFVIFMMYVLRTIVLKTNSGMQYLTFSNSNLFTHFRQQMTNNDIRHNTPTTCRRRHFHERRTKTNSIHFQKTNVIKTALKSPMAAISRNILDRYSEYRQLQRVPDFGELYYPRFCVVELEVDGETNTFIAGTELTVRIHLYNGYNQSLTQGGDLLNIWLTTENKTSSVAGYVVDHMNGTYTGHVMAFWAGIVLLKLSVTNTKEGIGLYTNYVDAHGSYKFINATFSEKNQSEMTQCAPKPSDWLNKTYGGFCDLTQENYNISLFCGKPKYVSCRNWVKFGWDDSLYYGNYTRDILRCKDEVPKQFNLTVIPSSRGDLDYPLPSTNCNSLPRASTWNSTVPSGFLYKGVYHNLICRPTVDFNRDQYRACLKNRPIISIGDSTTRQWFSRLVTDLGMNYSDGFVDNASWQKFARAHNTNYGLDMEWQPHELPFHGSPGSDRNNVKSVAYRLDQIPSKSTAIVIIHWYAHIARCCDHVALREHVANAKAAILRLLTRSPDVQVFIKGPHLVTFYNANKPYAYIGMFVEQVLFEVFNDLLHRVIYLDQWDMSVANENVNIHPDQILDHISLHNLINFACK